MNTLIISNKGLIDHNDLCLIGSSTKRGDDTKIGMFGSGWKYALAWFLRNDIDIKIFSGEEEIIIDYEIVLHRDKPIRVLTVNEAKTSITAEMGPQWTGWMALREIISNAIDEGDNTVQTALNVIPKGVPDNTTICIPLNNELSKVIREYDYYFAFERKETFKNEIGRVFLKNDYSVINVYRKGIRCFDVPSTYDEKKYDTKLDFDFENIDINESRTASLYEIFNLRKKFINKGVSPEILLQAIKEDMMYNFMSTHNINTVKILIEQGYKFIPKLQAVFQGITAIEDDHTIIMNDECYKDLVDKGVIISINGLNMKGIMYVESNKINVKEVEYHLSGIGLENIKVKCAQYNEYYNDVLLYDNYTILIRDSISYASTKELACKCIKELSPEVLEIIFK